MSMIPNLGDQFNYKKGIISGDECVLISPKEIGVSWSEENKHFRSVILRKSDGRCISRGFSRFCNWGETPNFEPWNPEWDFECLTKKDGSLVLISKHNGELILRTRNTFDLRVHETGEEFVGLMEKYEKMFNGRFVNSERYTVLCEHTTPNRVIVVRESNEPELFLLGVINNETAKLLSQRDCDILAKEWGIQRPEKHLYLSVQECLDDVILWQDKEGVVLYHEPTQTLKKIKADLYLTRHRLRSHISSISNLVDFYMTTGKEADYNAFFKVIEQSLDFELALQAKNDIEKITFAHQVINCEMTKVEWKIEPLKSLGRKEAANIITRKYNDWQKTYAFMALDNKPIPDRMLGELILNLCKG